ncbi:unnamed protein product [Sphenostylis stenocarpa]|uniref:Uncharacterized protein n=1 Tax=Sphenostylis stenocarpa TaxID=92480 RepID=A0AA86SMX7_9FABA|nr:unnamed protein product [Sphenostylis stenocarpa]
MIKLRNLKPNPNDANSVKHLLEVLNGEAINGSPEIAQHGNGDGMNEDEESDEVRVWNVKVEEAMEEAVMVFRIVERKQMVQCN